MRILNDYVISETEVTLNSALLYEYIFLLLFILNAKQFIVWRHEREQMNGWRHKFYITYMKFAYD